jgi:hypothetical protein
MTNDQREALARLQRKSDELNAKHPVTVGLPPEIAGNAPKTNSARPALRKVRRNCGTCQT